MYSSVTDPSSIQAQNLDLFPSVAASTRNRVKVKLGSTLSLWEILLFGVICSADMLTTIYWYLHGQATEGNPILSYWLSRSVAAFCVAKLLSFVPLLVICAVLRRKYARVITVGLRLALVAYVGIYLVSVGAQLLFP